VTMTTPDKLKTSKVIGIYGIPGSGKTTPSHELKVVLDVGRFSFYEGSEMIERTIDSGLTAFRNLDEQSKEKSRRLAIQTIHDDCAKNRKTAIVTGNVLMRNVQDCVVRGCSVCLPILLAMPTIAYRKLPLSV
jgi:adenylate kinase